MDFKKQTAAVISLSIIVISVFIYSFISRNNDSSTTVLTVHESSYVQTEAYADKTAISSAKVPEPEKTTSVHTKITSSEPETSAQTVTESLLININTASREELMLLNGIGEVTADSIIAYRNDSGGFNNIEELMNVSGIGQAKFDAVKDHVFVEDPVYPVQEEVREQPEYLSESETEVTEEIPPETEVSAESETSLTLEDCAPININTAEVDELMLLPYIDRETADEIISIRSQIGAYSHVYEILLVESLTQSQAAESGGFYETQFTFQNFYKNRFSAVVLIYRNYRGLVLYFRQKGISRTCRITSRNDLAYLLRKGQSSRSAHNDRIFGNLRLHLVRILLLRRNADLSRNDCSHGTYFTNFMGTQSVSRRKLRSSREYYSTC